MGYAKRSIRQLQSKFQKLKLHFKERIIIHKGKCKRGGPLIYNSNIVLEEASGGITFNDIIDGEVQIPEQLTQFFTHLVVGPDHRSHGSASKIRRVESGC